VSAEGLRVLPSKHDPAETLERLEAAILRHGFKIAARIDHQAMAAAVGIEVRPTVVVMFGDPRAGAPTLQTVQTLAIDLPLKILIWQDEKGATNVAYNDGAWLLARHGLADASIVEIMNEVMANIAGEAAS
jgi:uncharacterized protein (DUF302 family)